MSEGRKARVDERGGLYLSSIFLASRSWINRGPSLSDQPRDQSRDKTHQPHLTLEQVPVSCTKTVQLDYSDSFHAMLASLTPGTQRHVVKTFLL